MDPANTISQQLTTGEKLLWSGIPSQGLMLRDTDALMIPFSLMWGGFAIFWEWSAIQIPTNNNSASLVFPAWGIPFVLVGLYLIFGRFIADAWMRSKTSYGVTDQRILIASHGFSKKVESFPLRTLPQLDLVEKSNGRGTIRIGSNSGFGSALQGPNIFSPRGQRAPSLDGIENAKGVYTLILDAQRQVEMR